MNCNMSHPPTLPKFDFEHENTSLDVLTSTLHIPDYLLSTPASTNIHKANPPNTFKASSASTTRLKTSPRIYPRTHLASNTVDEPEYEVIDKSDVPAGSECAYESIGQGDGDFEVLKNGGVGEMNDVRGWWKWNW
jgi:hypothetical protein